MELRVQVLQCLGLCEEVRACSGAQAGSSLEANLNLEAWLDLQSTVMVICEMFP